MAGNTIAPSIHILEEDEHNKLNNISSTALTPRSTVLLSKFGRKDLASL
ncbi:MAG: hypothetical protein HDS83_04020 [Bacteroidales bacterium]|nr:hypothetical protein [Bacteroidales bacterium]